MNEFYDIDDVEQGIITQEEYDRQGECEDEVFHVVCHHCGMEVDPHEEPVYCWNFYVAKGHGSKQVFCCSGCDAEHRTNYSITLKVKEALKETGHG